MSDEQQPTKTSSTTQPVAELPPAKPEELIAFPQTAEKRPVVFLFQPTHYRVVNTPEELKVWERWMSERIGFAQDSPHLSNRLRSPYPHETISSCGDWDDCDEL